VNAEDALPGHGEPPEADRRSAADRRRGERRRADEPVEVERRHGEERRVARPRRRGMNQYDLDEAELEFIAAISRFKERSGRAFPTWSEVLGILRDLGYEKRS
jgi:hypothetical protein